MDTKQLSLAIRLAETLHFGKTAEIENIAQSGLSTQIAKLEDEIGFKIFNRTNRRVSLTKAGEEFIEKTRLILNDLNKNIQNSQNIAKQHKQTLRVGFFAEGAGELTHSIFSLFKKINPEVNLTIIELNMINQIQSLISKHVDIAIIRLPINDDRLEFNLMYDEPRVAVVPITHYLADANSLSMTDLFEQPFAVAGEGAPNEWASFWSLAEEFNGSCRVGAHVHSVPESLSAVAYSGVVDTFPLSASRMFSHPGVKYIPIVNASRSQLAVATIAGNRHPLVESFRNCVQLTIDSSISFLNEARILNHQLITAKSHG